MRKTATAVTLVLAFLLALAETLLIQNATNELIVRGQPDTNGNTINDGNPDASITITLPKSKVYNTENVTVAFTIESKVPPLGHFTGGLFDPFLRYGCLLDYDCSKLTLGFPNSNVDIVLSYNGKSNVSTCNATLTKLSQGPHNITAWVQKELNYLSYGLPVGSVFSTVSFHVDSVPPHIMILSPETKAYNTSDVTLDFTINETFSQTSYSLDGQENITAAGNVTLTRLSGGAHNVTVYATDDAGNTGTSETVYFNVDVPEPFPTVSLIAVSAIVVVAAVGLLLFFKKRKHHSLTSFTTLNSN